MRAMRTSDRWRGILLRERRGKLGEHVGMTGSGDTGWMVLPVIAGVVERCTVRGGLRLRGRGKVGGRGGIGGWRVGEGVHRWLAIDGSGGFLVGEEVHGSLGLVVVGEGVELGGKEGLKGMRWRGTGKRGVTHLGRLLFDELPIGRRGAEGVLEGVGF